MTGTPHGTVFSGVSAGHMLGGMLRWVFGGWGESLPDRVIAVYVEDVRAARAY